MNTNVNCKYYVTDHKQQALLVLPARRHCRYKEQALDAQSARSSQKRMSRAQSQRVPIKRSHRSVRKIHHRRKTKEVPPLRMKRNRARNSK